MHSSIEVEPEELRRLASFAVLLALGVVLWVLEGFFPPLLPLPGVKLGLTNIITVFTMLYLGLRAGIVLAVMRSLLGSFIGGTFLSVGFFLSFAGALASALLEAFCLRYCRRAFSLVGICIVGATAHNLAQLALVYALFVQSFGILYYTPVLLLAALASGSLTGALLVYLDRRLALTTGGGPVKMYSD